MMPLIVANGGRGLSAEYTMLDKRGSGSLSTMLHTSVSSFAPLRHPYRSRMDKGRTIKKVMGGWGKKTKKNSCKGKCQEKKFMQRRR